MKKTPKSDSKKKPRASRGKKPKAVKRTRMSPHAPCKTVGSQHGLGWRYCIGCDTVYRAGTSSVPLHSKRKASKKERA